MKTIKKFKLAIEPTQKIAMPFNSEILSVISKDGKAEICVLADESYSNIDRSFVIVAMDKEVPQRLNVTHHVGTFSHDGHALFVFEER